MPKHRLSSSKAISPCIRYFPIVRDVLKANISALAERSAKSRGEVYEGIEAQVEHCSSEWRAGRKPAINYRNPLCRLAYLYGAVPATANLIESVFRADESLADYFDTVHRTKGSVGICAFGGGPGTELLALCKWLELRNLKKPAYLDYLVLDRVTEWLDSWKAIKMNIEGRFSQCISKDRQRWPAILSGCFSAVDINKMDGFASLGTIFDQDIYILSYVISEIYEHFKDFRAFVRAVSESAPRGARFVFIDRRGSNWMEQIRVLAKAARLRLSEFHEAQDSMDFTEQASDLGHVTKKLGTHPRLTWDAFWVVGRKR